MSERQVPKSCQETYNKRATSRKAAIRSFCLECMAYARDEVRQCSDHGCPLFAFRLRG